MTVKNVSVANFLWLEAGTWVGQNCPQQRNGYPIISGTVRFKTYFPHICLVIRPLAPILGSEIKVLFIMNLLTLLGHEHHQPFGVQYFLFLCYLKNKALFRKMNDPGYLSVFPAPTLSHLSQNHTPLPWDHGQVGNSMTMLEGSQGLPWIPHLLCL